jgi:hypothetical protein
MNQPRNEDAERRIAAHYAPPAPAPPHVGYAPPYPLPQYIARADVRNGFLKWLFLTAAVAAFFLSALAYFVPLPYPLLKTLGAVLPMLALVKGIVGLFWLHGAWSELPPAYLREIKQTPGNVVVMYFVPFYNLYWAFASQSLLCTGIDTLLARTGHAPRAPRGLALLAPSVHIVSTLVGLTKEPVLVFCGTTAAAAAWFAMMFAFDRVLRDMHGALANAPNVANGY